VNSEYLNCKEGITQLEVQIFTSIFLYFIFNLSCLIRKLCELNNCDGEWGYAYDILSCLIHGRDKICKKICNDKYADINQEDIDGGTVLIKRYIPEYDYDILKNTVYTEEGIKSLYKDEKNKYFRLQLFRQLREITNKIELEPSDDAWVKFIDEKMVLIGCKDNPVTAV